MNYLELASSFIGTTYKNNNTPFNKWFYDRTVEGDLYPWCITFISYCLSTVGIPIYTASVKQLVSIGHITEPKIGSIFVKIENKRYVHAGFVLSLSDTSFTTIEGNGYIDKDISGVISKTRELDNSYIFIEIGSQ